MRLELWVRRARGGAIGLGLLLAAGSSHADGSAYMVKNINTGPDPQLGSGAQGFADIGSAVLFVATDDTYGQRLWRTDATDANTRRVSDVAASPGIAFQGLYYFHGPDGLYRSDGTKAGTFRVVSVPAQPIVAVGKTLYLQDYQPGTCDCCDGVWRLWTSDGSAAETHVIAQFDNNGEDPRFVAAGRKLFFVAGGSAGYGLWLSDGTAVGTVLVKAEDVEAIFPVANTVYFSIYDYTSDSFALWRTDGTAAGTALVGPLDSDPILAALNGRLFFITTGDGSVTELWTSDGTEPGTHLVVSIDSSLNSGPGLAAANGHLVFATQNGTHNVWTSDGTAAGTTVLGEIVSEPNYWIGPVVGVGNAVFLAVPHDQHQELWRTDGTDAGTTLVRTFTEVAPVFATTRGTFLVANDGRIGSEPWFTDGTPAGTVSLGNLTIGEGGSNPHDLIELNGVLVFGADDGIHGDELWHSDGTEGGTALVADIDPGENGSAPGGTVSAGGVLYFAADDGQHGRELWRTDGTAAGTRLVRDINPGTNGSSPQQLLAVGAAVYFFADDGVHGIELWKSDGTRDGTVLVDDIHPGPNGSFACAPSSGRCPMLTSSQDLVFFGADDGVHGAELWRTDGTAERTVLVSDINPGPGGSFPSYITDFGGFIVFGTEPEGASPELWRSNGSADGTVRLASIGIASQPALVNGQLFFTGEGTQPTLWQSDGTPNGTVVSNPGLYPAALIGVADTLFITAGSSLYDQCTELGPMFGPDDDYRWRISALAGAAERVFFAERDTYSDLQQLWTSDGTSAGTIDLHDFPHSPGDDYLGIEFIMASGSHAFFSASQGTANRELWALPLDAVPPVDPNACPAPAPSGDCCSLHPGGGCNDGACQSCVCAIDGECCGGAWDATCAVDANVQCSDSCPCQASGDCCSAHGDPSCSDFACRSCVCAIESQCCSAVWDHTCAAAATTGCASSCQCAGARDCCTVHDGPSCGDDLCRSCVCNLDGACCGSVWDQTCTDEAAVQCRDACACVTGGDCCSAHASTPGCAETSCRACVCTIDASCCSEAAGWSAACVAKANADCAASCPCTPKSSCRDTHADTVGCDDERCQLCVCDLDPPCCQQGWADYCSADAANQCAARCGDHPTMACVGDCNSDATVTIEELLTGVNIALGTAPLQACPAFDCQHDGTVRINCLIEGMNAALSGCASALFYRSTRVAVAHGPAFVAVADMNGDGTPDLVTINSLSAGVLLGRGDGSFAPAQIVPIDAGPSDLGAIGDLNGDGRPDLAADRYSGAVVLLAREDGTFAAAQDYGAGQYSIREGDLNADGNPDLVTTDGSGVDVLLGRGDGTFTTAQRFPVGVNPTNPATLADVNGDGHLDVITANTGSNDVSVLLGRGDGTFTSAKNLAVGLGPHTVVAADVDGNGHPDLITANQFSNDVSVLLGLGDGNFAAKQDFAVGTDPTWVAAVDLDGNGHLDLIAINYYSDDVSVLLGKGDGTFAPAQASAVGRHPGRLLIADLNGDGHPDLITVNEFSDDVSVLIGKGDGTFAATQSFAVGSGPTSVAVADLNGDGRPDLVTANATASTVSVLLARP